MSIAKEINSPVESPSANPPMLPEVDQSEWSRTAERIAKVAAVGFAGLTVLAFLATIGFAIAFFVGLIPIGALAALSTFALTIITTSPTVGACFLSIASLFAAQQFESVAAKTCLY